MSKIKIDASDMDNKARITLGLLNMVHDNEHASQRSMADGLGIALGLTNAYLKRCVKKGLIKISHAPANRYAYYLTPQGFSEKTRLTAEFLSQSFNLFRHARSAGASIFDQCLKNDWTRVALYGSGDLAEIFTFSARDFDIELIYVIATSPTTNEFAALPVITPDACGLDAPDAIVICDISDPQAAYDNAIRILPKSHVLTPRFLGVVDPETLTPVGVKGAAE